MIIEIKCDLREIHGVPEIKHPYTIGYTNCVAYNAANLELTTTTRTSSQDILEGLSNMLSRSVLSPYNENYDQAYKAIIESSDLTKYQFVTLFAVDPGIQNTKPLFEHNLINLFEAIISPTETDDLERHEFRSFEQKVGYKVPHKKFPLIEVANSKGMTHLEYSMFYLEENGKYTISENLALYMLSKKHSASRYYSKISQRLEPYKFAKHLEKAFISDLKFSLEALQICETPEGETVQILEKETTCADIGALPTSHHDTLDIFCEKKADKSAPLAKGIPINCENFDLYINFDEKGNIDTFITEVKLYGNGVNVEWV